MTEFLIGAAPASYGACECGCCEQLTIKPGETQPLRLNFAPWIADIRAKGIVSGGTEILVERTTITESGIASDLSFSLAAPGALNVSIALASDLVGAVYSLTNTPQHGVASVGASSGALSYSAAAGESGEDLLIIAVSQGSQTVMRRVTISVTAQADLSFVASAGRAFVGNVAQPTIDPAGATYQLDSGAVGATIYVEPGLNGVRSVLNPANLAAVGPNYFTVVQTKFGTVQLAWDGRFWYVPQDNISGLDIFTFDVLDSTDTVVATRTVVIQLQSLWVNADRVTVKNPVLTFPITAQRDAAIGDVWKITVFQRAQDCNGCDYVHTSCYEVTISKC